MSKTALLVVDVQKGLFNKVTTVYNSEQMLSNINILEAKARAVNAPIVYIQHENKTLSKSSFDWQLHPSLTPSTQDIRISKVKSNAFEDTELNQILLDLDVDTVVVCGLVSHGCVKRTAMGAADHGYVVYLASDAHSNWRKDASELIDQVNLEMDSQGIEIRTTDTITF